MKLIIYDSQGGMMYIEHPHPDIADNEASKRQHDSRCHPNIFDVRQYGMACLKAPAQRCLKS